MEWEGRARDRERNPSGPLDWKPAQPSLWVVFRSGASDFKSGIQATGEKGHPGLRGPGVGSLSSLFVSGAAWLQPSRRHNKGGRCRTAQAREPPGPLGMVVRPPDGRSPARGPAAAVAALVRTRAHFRPAPACLGRTRGFPVVRPRRRGRYPSLPIPPRPDWLIQLCAASRLAPEVASLFRSRTYIFLRCRAGWGEWGLGRLERGCPRGWRRGCCRGLISGILGAGPTPPRGTPHAPVGVRVPPDAALPASAKLLKFAPRPPPSARETPPGPSDRQSPTPGAAGLTGRGVRRGRGPRGGGGGAGRMRGAGGRMFQVFETGIWVFHVGRAARRAARAPSRASLGLGPGPGAGVRRPHARARARPAPEAAERRPGLARSRSLGPGGAARRCSGAGPAGVGGCAGGAGALHFLCSAGLRGVGRRKRKAARGVAGDRGEPC